MITNTHSTDTTRATPLDIHIHIIGNGSSNSGCWLRVSGYHRLLAHIILRQLKIPCSALNGELDQIYIAKLLAMIRGSELTHGVILAHENVYDDCGKIVEGFGSFYVPNDYVLRLAREHSEFLPGVSIHPGRPDAIDELERCLEAGAVLMKCLPNCQNIDCSDPRYTRFWQRMADAKLPLLAHTGGELSVPVYNRRFADPSFLRLPLECGVNVIAAHCGTNSLVFDRNYFGVFCEMIERYPNLYGDNSGMQTPFRSRHFPRLLAPEIMRRIVHGSDFPIPISGLWARLRGLINCEAARAASRSDNLLERDLDLKRAMGFDGATFTRAWSLLRLGSEPAVYSCLQKS